MSIGNILNNNLLQSVIDSSSRALLLKLGHTYISKQIKFINFNNSEIYIYIVSLWSWNRTSYFVVYIGINHEHITINYATRVNSTSFSMFCNKSFAIWDEACIATHAIVIIIETFTALYSELFSTISKSKSIA